MLVLSRKRMEVIRIGRNIQVTVLAIEGGKVRLGLDAPRDVPIHRAELENWGLSDDEDVKAHAGCKPR